MGSISGEDCSINTVSHMPTADFVGGRVRGVQSCSRGKAQSWASGVRVKGRKNESTVTWGWFTPSPLELVDPELGQLGTRAIGVARPLVADVHQGEVLG